MTEVSTLHPTPDAAASTSAAAPQAAQTPTTTQADPQVDTEAAIDPPKKHGIAAVVEKIVHPLHGSHHEHSHTDTTTVPVDKAPEISDGSTAAANVTPSH
ncbi:hypothetical protein DFH07DRAFT_1062596 [Mycena maculata]|uniref:Uncharacterized protein n=1 Tax=Mycena maculata TaxID=230809 RepID=A0AAD7N742_9AGAR|nr:hypothetical protein DFH07DRAFT_1062596 [Mycena maculata]